VGKGGPTTSFIESLSLLLSISNDKIKKKKKKNRRKPRGGRKNRTRLKFKKSGEAALSSPKERRGEEKKGTKAHWINPRQKLERDWEGEKEKRTRKKDEKKKADNKRQLEGAH